MQHETHSPCADALPADPITLAEGARLLTISPSSMWRWMRAGLVRGWRVGGRWRISRGEVVSLIRMNEPRPDVAERASRAAELAEVDAILRAHGVRR